MLLLFVILIFLSVESVLSNRVPELFSYSLLKDKWAFNGVIFIIFDKKFTISLISWFLKVSNSEIIFLRMYL